MISYKKIIIGLIYAAISLNGPPLLAESKFEATKKNIDIPDLTFMNESRLDKFSNYRGKVVLLNLWAVDGDRLLRVTTLCTPLDTNYLKTQRNIFLSTFMIVK